MSRSKKKVMIILFVILIGLVVLATVYIQANKYIYKNRVITYLIEENDYKNEEIESVKGMWGKLPTFYAIVTFKNEPEVEYIYFAHRDVFQSGYQINDEGQRVGIKEEDLKNYKPHY